MAENMFYDGIKYYKKKGYWKPTIKSREDLHRYIYKKYCGEIKDGHIIHHIDGNPSNNDISNLKMMTRSEHQIYHSNNQSKETRSKLSRALIGHFVSEETKKKIGDANRGQIRPKTKEARKNIAKALSKKTRCIELDIIFPSAKIAGYLMSCDSRKITSVCRGERHTHNKYHWEYINGGAI